MKSWALHVGFATFLFLCVGGDSQTSSTTSEPKNKTTTTQTLSEITGLSHGIKSDPIQILTPQILLIPNFHFDGETPDMSFILGSGQNITNNGTFLNKMSDGSEINSRLFNGENVTLKLPSILKNYDWILIWCEDLNETLGFVRLPNSYSLYPTQTFGFDGEAKSGPVVIVDPKTLYIPNLRYDGTHEDTHFWAGNGTEPTTEGVIVPDEKGSLGNLCSYHGENVNIRLPEGVTTDNIEYFGIYSKVDGGLGHSIMVGLSGGPKSAPRTFSGLEKSVMWLPKCCPNFSVLSVKGCVEKAGISFEPKVGVWEHNKTHLNNVSLDLGGINFQPYFYSLKCNVGKYPLDENHENFAILQNGSLILNSETVNAILSQGEYCLETISELDDLHPQVFVCVPEIEINYAMFNTYIVLVVISAISFGIVTILYYIVYKFENIHKHCFALYALSMCMNFISLIIVQTQHIENTGCEILGFLFQFTMISSFTWMAILCFDMGFIVYYFSDNTRTGKRMWWYIPIGLVLPILSIIVSLSRNLIPDVPNSFFKPQYRSNTCYYETENQRSIYFYVPIILTIVASVVFLVYTKVKIVQNDKNEKYSYFWSDVVTKYKFMFRQCLITLCIMVICFISNVLMNFIDEASGGFLNAVIILESMQGLFVVLIFSLHHVGSQYLQSRDIKATDESNEMAPINSSAING